MIVGENMVCKLENELGHLSTSKSDENPLHSVRCYGAMRAIIVYVLAVEISPNQRRKLMFVSGKPTNFAPSNSEPWTATLAYSWPVKAVLGRIFVDAEATWRALVDIGRKLPGLGRRRSQGWTPC